MEGEKSRVMECTTTNFNGCALPPPPRAPWPWLTSGGTPRLIGQGD